MLQNVCESEMYDIVYNIEMQTTKNIALPKRTRYYQGIIDLDLIHRGQSYDQLNKSYIIFICTFDPFGGDILFITLKIDVLMI